MPTGAMVGGKGGVQEGGEGGGGWLSGFSAAAPEVPKDVESGSADRGVPVGSKGEPKHGRGGEVEVGEGR
jgi:hypothetical protein